MNNSRPNLPIHLICNAHLDPVWKWDWEEGLTEALSTFETAADLLEEDPDFIFNHNESVLYEWVLEYRPDLFARIQKLVASGRWHISGGWYLQPDCNLPDGESFVRQILIGRNFFRTHFQVEPRLAYNFDAFGHHGNLPQILKKSGYLAYIHFRPNAADLKLPGDLYTWEGIDGSQVLGYRPPFTWYGTDDQKDLQERIQASVDGQFGASIPVGIFWGMGDHGGGATRADLKVIRALQPKNPQVRHSTTDALLTDLKSQKAPLFKGDLQRCFTGCYTSVSATKQSNRRSEALVQLAERYATSAWWFLKRPYPAEKLTKIWKDVLFNQFHDILPGSSTRTAIAGTYEIAGRAMKEAREIILHSQLALMAKSTRRKALTIVVFNPQPVACRLPVDLEYMVAHRPILNRFVETRITAAGGRTIPSQEEMPGAIATKFDWRKRVVFEADLPALGYAEFTVHLDTRQPDLQPKISSRSKKIWEWKNAYYRFTLDGKTGFAKTMATQPGGKSLLKGAAGMLGVFEDPGDAWGTDIKRYDRRIGDFRLATPREAADLTGQTHLEAVEPIRIIEEGAVRTIVEALFVYDRSTAAIRYTLYRNRPEIEAEVRLIWNQPRRQVKWIWPTRCNHAEYLAEIPYGDLSRNQNEGEHTHLRWLALIDKTDPSAAFGISGLGPSGHDVSIGEIRITLLRSAIYLHGNMNALREKRFHDFMDLGEARFRFVLLPTTAAQVRSDMVRLTNNMTLPGTPLIHYPLAPESRRGVPGGQSLISLVGDGLEMGAIKRSEDGRDLILRIVERNGETSRGKLKISGLRNGLPVHLSPYEIKTLRVSRRGKIRECDLLERPLKK